MDPLGYHVWQGRVPSRLLGRQQGPVGPPVADRALSASLRPTTYYIYNSYNPNARFAINH
jgi:hypothetical protein